MSRIQKNIVWLQTGFLGDIVLTTAAVRLGRKFFPEARHHVVTTRIGAEALKAEGYASVVCFQKRGSLLASFLEVRRRLKEKGCCANDTILLQCHRSYRSSLLAKFLGFNSVTYRQSSWSFLASQRVERVAVLHEAARIGLLLEPLGVPRQEILAARPSLEPAEGKGALVQALGESDGPLIGIAPGSVWGTKRWPSERYAALAKRILESSPSVRLVIIGSQAEQEDAARVAADVQRFSERVLNLAGQTSLDDLRFLYPRLDLIVANDSSPIHYASCFDVPTVAVFGATVPSLGFGPLATKRVVVENQSLSCRPCGAHGPQICPLRHFKCMQEIQVDQVFDACRSVLPQGLLKA